jgi:hypothetical protein
VVHRWVHLTLITVHGGRDAPHAVTARLPVVAVIMVSHGPLRALLAPLSASLDALLSAMDGDIR